MIATAAAFWPLLARPAPRCPIWLQCLVVIAVVGAMMAPLPEWIFTKEGLVEAVAEGLLLALIAGALQDRQWLLALAATLLLAEELDYGVVLFDFDPFIVVGSADAGGQYFNSHNGATSALWRIIPVAGVLVLATRRLYAVTSRLKLPRLHATARPAMIITVLVSIAIGLLDSTDRVADEVFELLAVAVVANTWLRDRIE